MHGGRVAARPPLPFFKKKIKVERGGPKGEFPPSFAVVPLGSPHLAYISTKALPGTI